MKVALVINTSWNIYNFRSGLVRALQQAGHEVVCIAPYDSYSERLKKMGCTYIPFTMESRGVNPTKDIGVFRQLRKIYKRVSPDVVLHYTIKPNIYGTLAARSLGIPMINNVCGLGSSIIQGGMISRIVFTLYKTAFTVSSKVFFQNSEDKDLFISKKLVKQDKTDLLPGSGIDTEKFQPIPSDENDTFTFLMISRLIRDKGVIEFMEAARKIKSQNPQINFKLLGQIVDHPKHGISKELLQSWVNEGLVEYLGTTDDVRSIIADSDCVVLPSYREGTPRTLLEAGSMAKPLIATNTAGCNQVVQDGLNGMLCEVKDSTDLAEKMNAMLNKTPHEIQHLGNYSRKYITENFSEQFVIDKYLDAIHNFRRSH